MVGALFAVVGCSGGWSPAYTDTQRPIDSRAEDGAVDSAVDDTADSQDTQQGDAVLGVYSTVLYEILMLEDQGGDIEIVGWDSGSTQGVMEVFEIEAGTFRVVAVFEDACNASEFIVFNPGAMETWTHDSYPWQLLDGDCNIE
jgi:hypothetical protein